MKKIYLTLLGFMFLCPAIIHAQKQNLQIQRQRQINARESAVAPEPERCGFAAMMDRARKKGFNDELYEKTLAELIRRRKETLGARFTGPVTIPVIFHVIHYATPTDPLGAGSNIPANFINAQIEQLNLDYRNMNIDGSIWPQALDMDIQFCAALADTAGRPLAEPGIQRVDGTQWAATLESGTLVTYPAIFDAVVKPATYWDPYTYFNIWTAPAGASLLLGYATFPSMSGLEGMSEDETDELAGVFINWTSVGSVEVPNPNGSPYDLGRTLTHEAGHFFGLRHIWGDGNCTASDYCNDTPPQAASTGGCPANGVPNGCTPSQPKMFQNYMDYSNDVCMNTFTADQTTRSQTVMDNSPRRKELLESKACQLRPVNSVEFTRRLYSSVDETAPGGGLLGGSTCPATKSFDAYVGISGPATGTATLTFTSLGTAEQGSDYTVTPATLTYTAGDAAVKKITITILDDKAPELVENIEIGFSISGTGIVAGPDKQSLKISIADDDKMFIVDHLNATSTPLTQNFQTNTNIPAGWVTEAYKLTNSSYTANQWVVSANTGVDFANSNGAHITQNTTTKPNTYNKVNVSDAYLITPLIDAVGMTDINLSFAWKSIGEQVASTIYDAGYVGYIPEGKTPTAANVMWFEEAFVLQPAKTTTNLALPASMWGTKFYFVFNWFNDEVDGNNPGFTIDDIVLTGRKLAVATTTADVVTNAHYSGQTVQYIAGTAANRTIIAEISGLTENIGCITGAVQVAGTAKTAIVTNLETGFRTNKVIRITPPAANGNADYTIKLYYTVGELSPAFTGTEIPDLKIMKLVNGTYADNNYSAADGHLIPTTFEDHSAQGYYVYIGTVNDGFSDFILTDLNIILPVTLLSFDAKARTNDILLTWATAQESNNAGFQIERSTAGDAFQNIGWVNGSTNSLTATQYQFIDKDVLANVNYTYRIRMVSLDQQEKLSDIRFAVISKTGIDISLTPNPAKDKVNLLVSGISKPINVELLNSKGQKIRSWERLNVSGTNISLPLIGLASGLYILNIETENGITSKKLLIQ